jgi:hypothetical protein
VSDVTADQFVVNQHSLATPFLYKTGQNVTNQERLQRVAVEKSSQRQPPKSKEWF